MTLGLIWAQARDGAIGTGGRLPWSLPEDLALFRAVTRGGTVVMGRRTWESLPAAVRPLPGRDNVVLSRRPGWGAPGARTAGDLDAALAGATGPVWVIGGEAVYAAALPVAALAVVTDVDLAVPDADAHAPPVPASWAAVGDPAPPWRTSAGGPRFRVRVLEAVPGAAAGLLARVPQLCDAGHTESARADS